MARIKKGERRTTEQIQEAFLKAFEDTGNITLACKKARLPRRTFYNWLSSADTNKSFLTSFENSRIMAIGGLEDEAHRRAVTGLKKGIYYKGERIAWETEYSDTLLIVLLKAHAPERYKDRTSAEISGPNGTPIQQEVVTRVIFEDYGSRKDSTI
ncbi:hypothetical protein ACE38W_00540 [Chitinophaga sp. Hz27]|uniref:hypothetical protein n=1 Tax=Chitinophaga sp. Hz27 TaxID=3347169 RepID=UPI0035DD1846